MAEPTPDETMADLLCDALDGDDPVRLSLMVALALTGEPAITDDDRDRLRRDGVPPVFRL